MKSPWVVVTAVIIFALGIFGVYWLYQKRVVTPSQQASPLPTPVEGFDSQPTVEGVSKELAGKTPSSQPDTGPDNDQIKNAGIILNYPQEFSAVASPLQISGWTKIESGNLTIRVKDSSKNILGQKNTYSCPNFEVCQFEVTLIFSKPSTETGTIEVYSQSTMNNPPERFQTLVVQFK